MGYVSRTGIWNDGTVSTDTVAPGTSDRTPLAEYSAQDLAAFTQTQRTAYEELKGAGLSLDLTRGKPSSAQLDLANALLDLPSGPKSPGGVDTRNYGGLEGLPELRAIFADLLGVDLAQIIAGGNSSLTMMHETLVHLLLHGGVNSERPWSREEKVTFICPVPGYDRHFTMLAHHGIEMVAVPMHDDGPDVAACRELAQDPSVKGMWVVPTYANPSGSTVTQEVAAELASMPAAAPDFTIFWDNAYSLHHLTEHETKSADMLSLCAAAGNPHRTIMFASTSKITFAGAGVAFLASSVENIRWWLSHQQFASIGPDKVNHLRHLEFFGDAAGVRAHMVRHRESLAPKFAAVQEALAPLAGLGIATWTDPTGGYFVSLDVLPGTATRVVELAKEAGIALTPAGSSFPHGADPDDTNIRLAPSFPPLEEVRTAMAGVATCVALAAAEHLGRDA
ncbi:MAG TPA: aminotransferase class I/II-fold pyridoxal phosphate-dependent enzyme [Intrasporangiaceae bacterium]|nr:aminotransferase class I/II-fold pyridoxal phosphate-dependent enzyme [Intrasporangiaceae bacterium]